MIVPQTGGKLKATKIWTVLPPIQIEHFIVEVVKEMGIRNFFTFLIRYMYWK